MDALIRLDERLFLWVNNGWSSPGLDGLMSLATVAGQSVGWLFFGLVAILLWDGERRRSALLFVVAMAVGAAALHGVKQALPRDRPLKHFQSRIESGAVRVFAPHERLYHRSFPSGHSQAAFTAAGFFALRFRRRRALLYGAAAAVAVSRVYLAAHFPSDILAGSAMGWLAAWGTLTAWSPRPSGAADAGRTDEGAT